MEYQQVGPSLELDREILIAILASRYGLVPDALHQYIQHIDDETKLISLIRKAGGERTWRDVVRDFRVVEKSH
ncbi:MAG: hypothetical protein K6T83_10995 [Alicyclobacillus sp.]|nr:hypothetical protein [Alicyclobacillus sp.]